MQTINAAAREYASRPADERYSSLEAMIAAAAEDKRHSVERVYNWRDLRFQGAGGAVTLVSPRAEADLSHWSFGQVCRMLESPAAYLRDGLSAELAAECLNYRIGQAGHGEDVRLLVRAPNGNGRTVPLIRAATSDSYGRVWDADLYRAIGETFASDASWGLPPTWEGGADGPRAGAYRGDRDSFLIYCNGGSIVTDPSLYGRDDGTMFRGILVRNSEVGACSVVIDSILYRYICGNHILWGAVVDRSYRRRHVGARTLRDTIREIARIAWDWTRASAERDQAIIRALVSNEIARTREGVVDELRGLGATKEQAEAAVAECERRESVSPYSWWGAAQGLTRISQASGFQDARYGLDMLASQLLARGRRKVAA